MTKSHRPPKRIALVIKHLAERSGGAERVCCELANLLSESGFDVSCVVFDPPGPGPFFKLRPKVALVQLAGDVSDRTASILKIVSKLLPKSLRFRGFVRWHAINRGFVMQLRRFIDGAKPDVIISLLPTANTPVLVAAADRDVRVIVTNHNVPKEDYTNPKRWGGSSYDRELRLSSLDRADGIHVLFPKFGSWFPKHLQSRIVAIPNYVSDDFLNSETSSSERAHVIIGVGRLAPVKNYLTLLESWALLGEDRGDWQVRIFGTGPQATKLRRRIGKLGLDDSFKLMGTTQNVGIEYKTAAIMCHPAEFEGFGLAPAEALASKTPVLAFRDTPGIEEFLVDGKNASLVSVEGNAVENLANGLRQLMSDEALRQKLGQNGPQTVARFNKANHLKSWLAMIEKVMSEKPNAER